MTGRASITWPQALAWRMERHLLEPRGRLPVEEVVRRLCGVQAQVASPADLAVRVRQATSAAGEVGQALADGRLIKTWAMRARTEAGDPPAAALEADVARMSQLLGRPLETVIGRA